MPDMSHEILILDTVYKNAHACADRPLSFVTNVTFVFLNIIHKIVNLRTQFKFEVV